MWWSVLVEASTPNFVAAGDDQTVVLSISETLKAVQRG